MVKPWCKTAVCALVLLAAVHGSAQEIQVGPRHGTLVIVGGGGDIDAILARFLELAGGPDALIVVIPTAGAADEYNEYWPGLRRFREIGARNLRLLHTRDRLVADTEDFARPIRQARAVWFSGGRQWRLADSYLDTRVHRDLEALLERGGVIGGSSAGATIQGSYLARGDTQTNTIMMGDHEVGMGFLRDVAIDQHLLRRNRQFDLLEIIEAHPHLLGIGIDENTAIIVQDDMFEVAGAGYVAIYDRKRKIPPDGRFYFLSPGDTFNLKTREPFRSRRVREPLDRVIVETW